MGALKPLADRLESKLDKSGECWMWTGAKRPNGYGAIGMPRGGVESVHRVSYEIYVGPIPDEHHIDHLCRNRGCANPAHLEPVTQAENNRRAGAARRSNQTHCKRVHQFTDDNTFLTARGGRECRECRNMRNRASRRGMRDEMGGSWTDRIDIAGVLEARFPE